MKESNMLNMNYKITTSYKFRIITIVIILSSTNLLAKNRINFTLGKVDIMYRGKATPAKHGMKISKNALIITGRDGRITIYDDEKKRVYNIGPGKRVKLGSIRVANRSRARWRKSYKRSLLEYKSTTTASVRANEEGEKKVDWSDTEDDKIDRTADWKLHKEGNYKKLFENTKSANDDEGIFLNAVSTYMLRGISEERAVISNLKKVERMTSSKSLKGECRKMMAVINFEVGKYVQSLKQLKAYIRYRKEKDIDALSYYMLVMNNRHMGKRDEERKYLMKMKRYHKGSVLLREM